MRNANSGSTRSKEQKMFVYRGSTALITGASKGLGKVFAQTLAARGMNLVLVARSGDALQALATDLAGRYGVKSIALDADLSEPNAATQIAEELARRGVQVDLLINNAGLGLTGSFLSHDLRKKQSEILVNVHALAALSHVFGSGMAKRGSGGIINLASNASFQPIPFMATYAATKAFVLHFSEALQFELAGTGVHVMAACPGPTATSFFDGVSTNVSPKDMDSSESVVEKTLKAFDQGKAVAYPGRTSVRAATWLSRLLPRALVVRAAAMASGKMGLHG
jgi:short-subunit dehydrogenase